MPAKASDRPLSDTLSARSYLEPGQATHWSRHHEYPLQPTDRGLAGGLKDLEPTTESNNIEPVSMLDNDTAQEKRPKRGRPKLEPDGRVQFENRRAQVRRAQRAYRERREATVQSLRARVTDLETTLHNVSDILINFQGAVTGSDSNRGSTDIPSLSDTVDRILAEVEKSNCSDHRDNQQEILPENSCAAKHEAVFKPINYSQRSLIDVFGYHVSEQLEEEGEDEEYGQWRYQERLSQWRMPRPVSSSLIDAVLSGDSVHHSAFHPTELTNPRLILRILKLLQHAPNTGTGSHCAVDKDDSQALPIPSQDLRATLQQFLEFMLGLEHPESHREDHDLALIQDWVHCHDVRAYLEHMGIILDRSSLLVDIPIQTAIMLQGGNQINSKNERKGSDCVDLNGTDPDIQRGDLNSKGDESMRSDDAIRSMVPDTTQPDEEPDIQGSSDYFLDVECFFNMLRGNIKFLAYAPGSRRDDINSALKSSMRKRP